jgi:hypothetical protein
MHPVRRPASSAVRHQIRRNKNETERCEIIEAQCRRVTALVNALLTEDGPPPGGELWESETWCEFKNWRTTVTADHARRTLRRFKHASLALLRAPGLVIRTVLPSFNDFIAPKPAASRKPVKRKVTGPEHSR